MKFGIHNPSWLFGPDPATIFDGVRAKALWAENNGFAWFSVMDHLIQIPNVGAPDEPFMEGWTVLSALAAVTQRIRLATLVSSVGYRKPAHLAKIAAGVDHISRGRMTLGIGAGWFEAEYRQYGWEFPPRPAVRIQQMEEAVRLIIGMIPITVSPARSHKSPISSESTRTPACSFSSAARTRTMPKHTSCWLRR